MNEEQRIEKLYDRMAELAEVDTQGGNFLTVALRKDEIDLIMDSLNTRRNVLKWIREKESGADFPPRKGGSMTIEAEDGT